MRYSLTLPIALAALTTAPALLAQDAAPPADATTATTSAPPPTAPDNAEPVTETDPAAPATPATAATPSAAQASGKLALTPEQQAAYDAWPANARTYFDGLTASRQEIFLRLKDEDKLKIIALSPAQQASVWTSLEAQASGQQATTSDPK